MPMNLRVCKRSYADVIALPTIFFLIQLRIRLYRRAYASYRSAKQFVGVLAEPK